MVELEGVATMMAVTVVVVVEVVAFTALVIGVVVAVMELATGPGGD